MKSRQNVNVATWGIGCTGLLATFLDTCSQQRGGHLFFTAPFYDRTFLSDLASLFAAPRFSVEVIVNNARAGRDIESLFCKGNIKISVCLRHNLHAKVFIFESSAGKFTALIGSHNPTMSANVCNLEVGVFTAGVPHSATCQLVIDLRDCLRQEAIGKHSTNHARNSYVDCDYIN